MHKMRGQIIFVFFVMQIFAMMLANGLTIFLTSTTVNKEVTDSLYAQRIVALDLAKKTDLSAFEIASVLTSATVSLRLAEEEETQKLNQAQLFRIEHGGAVTLNNEAYTTYFSLAGEMVAMEQHFFSARSLQVGVRGFLNNLFFALIAFFAMFRPARRMSQPIVDLTEATRQVAEGNYDVQVRFSPKRRFLHPADEMRELTENFNHMTAELRSVEYLRRDFTSSVSHELKTPVASIAGYARLLQAEGITSEERNEYTRAILNESNRLASLSDNLLRLTRLESQHKKPAFALFDLSEQLRQSIAAVYPELERRNIEVEVDLPDLFITSDEELLGQVWINLIGNAVKFTPPGGQIQVALAADAETVRVKIADSGIGMDEATVSRVFEKFYQADSSHHTGGNGLGLALVKRIVDICGGKIEVESELGKGSAFTVVLPRRGGE